MKKREAAFTVLLRHWLKANPMWSCAMELKQSQTDSLPFSAVQEHQINSLLAAQSKFGLLYKIPDDSIGYKPFDMVYLREMPAYVVISYPIGFCFITINNFLHAKKTSKRRSLTWSAAGDISERVIITKKLSPAKK